MTRLQHAYAVQRLLSDPQIEIVLGDDVEIFDLRGNAIEAVHVGSPDQPFFDRAKERLRRNNEMTQRIVSLEPLRPFLKATLEEAGFSFKQAEALLPRFVLERIEPPRAISDAMHAWLHHARGRRISAVDVREVPEIAGRAADGGASDEELDAAFAKSTVVVIHGGTKMEREERASAYMRSGMPAAIRDAGVDDAHKLGVPLLVRVEESLGWAGEVEGWRRMKNVRVLASAPEAYWQRAYDTGATLLWAAVPLPPSGESVEEPAGLRAAFLEDIERYVRTHADLIETVHSRMPSSEVVWSILDPVGLATWAPSLTINDAISSLPEYREWWEDIQRRRPSSESIFPEARKWIAAQQSSGDEETLFWAAAWNIPIESTAPDAQEAIARFRGETATVAVEDDGETVIAHWLAPLEDFDLDRELVRRINLLRRLYPDRRHYGAQTGELKRTIAADEFPIPAVMRLHFHFTRVGTPSADTWDSYVEKIIALRRRVTTLANRITAALTTYFRRDKPVSVIDLGVEAEEWDTIMNALKSLPKLPRSAVDAWGWESEGGERAWSAGTPFAHAPYVNALNAYAKALHDFFNGSWQIFAANPQIGRGTPEARQKLAEWLQEQQISADPATVRLADAIAILKKVQEEFRLRFDSDAAFERQEHAALWQLWAVWFDFAYHPRRRIENAARDSVAAIDARIEERRRSLRKRFRTLELSRTEIHAENEQGLWLTVDVPHAPQVINAFAEALVQVIDVLRPPAELHAFDRYALDLVWGTVHLVPLVRGKSLEGKAWSLRILDLPRPDEKLDDHAWKFVQRSVADWPSLGLTLWPRAIATDARRFAPSVQQWRDTLTQLTNLREVPRPDELANEIATRYWRNAVEVSERQSAEVARILDALPQSLFAANDDAVQTLQAYVAGLRERIATIEPLDFDAMAEMRAAVAETLVPAAATISDLWIERELL